MSSLSLSIELKLGEPFFLCDASGEQSSATKKVNFYSCKVYNFILVLVLGVCMLRQFCTNRHMFVFCLVISVG